MASGGQTGGFGNMGGQQYGQQGSIDTFPVFNSQSGSQPSMAQQSMGQQSMGGYDPRMFGAPYTPPPPPAPAPAPAPRQSGFFFGQPTQYGGYQNPFMNLYQQRQQQSKQPAPPLQPSLSPGGREALYQTPQTPGRGMRPSSQAPQFYQPIYQPQYQNYNMGNPYGVSMYGQSPFMGGMGFNPYGGYGQSSFMGGMGGMGVNPYRTPGDDLPALPGSEAYLARQQSVSTQGRATPQDGGMTQQIPSFMQGAFSNMLQQQQAGRGGATPTGSQSASPMAGLGGLGIAGLMG